MKSDKCTVSKRESLSLLSAGAATARPQRPYVACSKTSAGRDGDNLVLPSEETANGRYSGFDEPVIHENSITKKSHMKSNDRQSGLADVQVTIKSNCIGWLTPHRWITNYSMNALLCLRSVVSPSGTVVRCPLSDRPLDFLTKNTYAFQLFTLDGSSGGSSLESGLLFGSTTCYDWFLTDFCEVCLASRFERGEAAWCRKVVWRGSNANQTKKRRVCEWSCKLKWRHMT